MLIYHLLLAVAPKEKCSAEQIVWEMFPLFFCFSSFLFGGGIWPGPLGEPVKAVWGVGGASKVAAGDNDHDLDGHSEDVDEDDVLVMMVTKMMMLNKKVQLSQASGSL